MACLPARFLATLLWGSLGLALGSGCVALSSRAHARDFEVAVEEVGLQVDEEGVGELTCRLWVQNPLSSSVEAVQLDWELWLEGRFFAAATQVLSLPLKPQERRGFSLLLPFRVRKAPLLTARDLRVGVRGGLLVQRTGFDRALRFEKKLVLPHTQLPSESLGRMDE